MTSNANDRLLDMIARGDTLSTVHHLTITQVEDEGLLALNKALYCGGPSARNLMENTRIRLLDEVKELSGKELAAALYTLGCIAMSQDDVLEALTRFNEVLELQPDNTMARHNLAYAKELLAEFEEARLHYQEVLKQNPDQVLTRLNLALLDLMDAEYETGLEVLQELHGNDPENLGLTLYLSRGLLMRGTTQDLEVVIDLTENVPGSKDFLDLRECRANALFLLGEIEAAEQAFVQLLEENPDSVFALTGRIKVLATNNAFSELGDYVRRLHELAPSEATAGLHEAVNG